MVVIQARILQESASYRYSNKSVKRVPARCLRGKTVQLEHLLKFGSSKPSCHSPWIFLGLMENAGWL
jgi:hypothetical protein